MCVRACVRVCVFVCARVCVYDVTRVSTVSSAVDYTDMFLLAILTSVLHFACVRAYDTMVEQLQLAYWNFTDWFSDETGNVYRHLVAHRCKRERRLEHKLVLGSSVEGIYNAFHWEGVDPRRPPGVLRTFLSGTHQADFISGEYGQISHELSLLLALIKSDICLSYPNLLSWNLGDHAKPDAPPSPRVTDLLILCFDFTDWCEELQPSVV